MRECLECSLGTVLCLSVHLCGGNICFQNPFVSHCHAQVISKVGSKDAIGSGAKHYVLYADSKKREMSKDTFVVLTLRAMHAFLAWGKLKVFSFYFIILEVG